MLPLSQSMRQNYANGVDEYYAKHAASTYRNPHYPGILKTLNTFLDIYFDNLGAIAAAESQLNILDLAAGSGEATEAVLNWERRRLLRKRSVPKKISITATDPYTSPAYVQRTNRPCLELSFADIANGQLPDETTQVYDLVICSFALHLLTDPSQLWALLYALSTRAKYLVVLAPHKKPAIKAEWGWCRVDPWSMLEVDEEADKPKQIGGNRGDGFEIYEERVRLRVWKSTAIRDDAENAGNEQA
jgi:hypothetical protein